MTDIGINRPSFGAKGPKAPKVSKAEQESRDAFRSMVRTGGPGAGKSPTSGLRARRPQVAQRLDSLAGAGTIAREDLVAAADSLTTLGRSNPQMADGVANALLRKDIDVRSAIAMSEALAKSPALAFMAAAHQDNILPLLNVAKESDPPAKMAQRLARLAEERPDLAGALVNAAAAPGTPPKAVALVARRLLKSPNLASTLEQMGREDLHRLTAKVVAAADGPQTLRRLADLGETHPGALRALAGALAIDKGEAGGKKYRALAAKILDDKSAADALDNVALSTPDHGASLATSLLRAQKPGEALHAVGADPNVAARMSDLAVRNPVAAIALMDGVRGLEPVRAAETLRRCAPEPAMAEMVVRDPRTFAKLVERFDFARPDAVAVARDPKTYAALVGVLDSAPVIGYGSVAQQIGVVAGVTEARRLFGSGPKAIKLENALLATAVADPGFAREAAANPQRAADALRAAQVLPGFPAGLEATPTAEQAAAIRKAVAPLGFDHPTQSMGQQQPNRVRHAAGAVLRFVGLPEPRGDTDAGVGFSAMASLGKALRVGTIDASRVETLRDAAEANLGVAHAVGGLKPKQVGAFATGLRCVRFVSGDEGMRAYAAKLGTERGGTAEATLAVGKEINRLRKEGATPEALSVSVKSAGRVLAMVNSVDERALADRIGSPVCAAEVRDLLDPVKGPTVEEYVDKHAMAKATTVSGLLKVGSVHSLLSARLKTADEALRERILDAAMKEPKAYEAVLRAWEKGFIAKDARDEEGHFVGCMTALADHPELCNLAAARAYAPRARSDATYEAIRAENKVPVLGKGFAVLRDIAVGTVHEATAGKSQMWGKLGSQNARDQEVLQASGFSAAFSPQAIAFLNSDEARNGGARALLKQAPWSFVVVCRAAEVCGLDQVRTAETRAMFDEKCSAMLGGKAGETAARTQRVAANLRSMRRLATKRTSNMASVFSEIDLIAEDPMEYRRQVAMEMTRNAGL